MRCDSAINEACEILGSFALIEEVINSVFGKPLALSLQCVQYAKVLSVYHSICGKTNRSNARLCDSRLLVSIIAGRRRTVRVGVVISQVFLQEETTVIDRTGFR
jgi:hypothetical protein